MNSQSKAIAKDPTYTPGASKQKKYVKVSYSAQVKDNNESLVPSEQSRLESSHRPTEQSNATSIRINYKNNPDLLAPAKIVKRALSTLTTFLKQQPSSSLLQNEASTEASDSILSLDDIKHAVNKGEVRRFCEFEELLKVMFNQAESKLDNILTQA